MRETERCYRYGEEASAEVKILDPCLNNVEHTRKAGSPVMQEMHSGYTDAMPALFSV